MIPAAAVIGIDAIGSTAFLRRAGDGSACPTQQQAMRNLSRSSRICSSQCGSDLRQLAVRNGCSEPRLWRQGWKLLRVLRALTTRRAQVVEMRKRLSAQIAARRNQQVSADLE